MLIVLIVIYFMVACLLQVTDLIEKQQTAPIWMSDAKVRGRSLTFNLTRL
jgi:hypothetical protein